MNIFISNRQRARKIDSRLLKKIAEEILAELKIQSAELGITLIGAMEMAEVNVKFLRHEGSTDVITFDHGEMRKAEGGKRKCLHGEIFICVSDAVSQSKQFKTSWQSEIVRYIVHGILHLLGHDDLKPELRRRMKREENRLVHLLTKRFSLAQLSRGVKLGA